jgi:hypothetical protein
MRVVDAHRGSANVVSEVGTFVFRLKEGMRQARLAHVRKPENQRMSDGNK